MRQGPHKNRSRSRGRRPTGNQSGRVYESNGPDVKVRGTAQTVADKYLQLARDAHSAGDTVMAEGYFQHAEHYLRIVAASQPLPQQNAPQRRDDYAYDDDEGDDEQPTPVASAIGSGRNGEAHRQPQPQQQPQPQPQARQAAAAPASDAGDRGGQQAGDQPSSDQPNGDQPSGDQPSGEQPWGGPEPEFLRRGPAANGSGRARRTRQPRSGNGRSEAAKTDSSGDAGGDDSGPQESAGQDSTEQA